MQREYQAQEPHTTITYGFFLMVSPTLHYLQLSLAIKPLMQYMLSLLCFPTLCIMCPCLHLHIAHNLSLFCGIQLEPKVLSFTRGGGITFVFKNSS